MYITSLFIYIYSFIPFKMKYICYLSNQKHLKQIQFNKSSSILYQFIGSKKAFYTKIDTCMLCKNNKKSRKGSQMFLKAI